MYAHGDPVGSWDPDGRKRWGASYATTTETDILPTIGFFYNGRAKASANLWGGVRIIQVCITYLRANYAAWVVPYGPDYDEFLMMPRCSNAKYNGWRWVPGPEVKADVTDSVDPNAPRTRFWWRIMKIDPDMEYGWNPIYECRYPQGPKC